MSVVAVDLAARYSAAVQFYGRRRTVLREYDSTAGEAPFLEAVLVTYEFDHAGQLVVEDLPHGVDYRALVKRVCQIQGRIVERMAAIDRLHQLLFVAPNTWRAAYPPLRKRGAGMEAVVPIARELGYQPPPLMHLAGPRGGGQLVRKVQTDYCAAYLIACWAHTTYLDHGTYDVPGTARYGTPAITKDAHA